MDTNIDFREFQPRFRHALFISLFERLKEDASFGFINDHDPLPLREQLEKLYLKNLIWDYEEQGPDVWKIRVSKKSSSAVKSEGCCGLCGGHKS